MTNGTSGRPKRNLGHLCGFFEGVRYGRWQSTRLKALAVGYRSRYGCATLPALIQRHAAVVPWGAPTRCYAPTACCILQVPTPRRSSGSGSSLLRSTNRLYEAPMMLSAHELCRVLSPFCEGMPSVTRNEITQAIEKLTEEIRTLSYSSTKAAAEKILQLQQRRRELRAQLEAAEP
jgi:hypothetical protein